MDQNIVCAAESCLGWTHLSCFGHNLHLAVQNSTKNERKVDRAVGVCKKLVSTFSHSWKKKREVRKIQEELGYHNIALSQIVLHGGVPQKR